MIFAILAMSSLQKFWDGLKYRNNSITPSEMIFFLLIVFLLLFYIFIRLIKNTKGKKESIYKKFERLAENENFDKPSYDAIIPKEVKKILKNESRFESAVKHYLLRHPEANPQIYSRINKIRTKLGFSPKKDLFPLHSTKEFHQGNNVEIVSMTTLRRYAGRIALVENDSFLVQLFEAMESFDEDFPKHTGIMCVIWRQNVGEYHFITRTNSNYEKPFIAVEHCDKYQLSNNRNYVEESVDIPVHFISYEKKTDNKIFPAIDDFKYKGKLVKLSTHGGTLETDVAIGSENTFIINFKIPLSKNPLTVHCYLTHKQTNIENNMFLYEVVFVNLSRKQYQKIQRYVLIEQRKSCVKSPPKQDDN